MSENGGIGESVVRKLYEQLMSGGSYFARFDGSAPYVWMRDAGLFHPYVTLIRVFHYGASAESEVYELQENGSLMRADDPKEYDPVELLDGESAQNGWEAHGFNPRKMRELNRE